MGLRRTAFAAAMISLAMLAGCSAASHPSALSPAAPSPVAAAPAPASTAPPNSIAASPTPAASSPIQSGSSASIAGTPTSAADSPPAAISSNDIATNVRTTAQAFIDDFNIAFATGDVTKITALTAPTCGCRSLVKLIENTYAQHQRIVGVVASLTSLQVVSFVAAGATADMHYSISAGRILDVSGNQVNTSVNNPDEHSAMFVLGTGGQWIVEQNTFLSAPSK